MLPALVRRERLGSQHRSHDEMQPAGSRLLHASGLCSPETERAIERIALPERMLKGSAKLPEPACSQRQVNRLVWLSLPALFQESASWLGLQLQRQLASQMG
jgi:hypothetical protein